MVMVGYTYYADGSMATMTDQNGTVHTYTRDTLGRVTADIVTLATGSAVDNSVLRTTTSYDNQVSVLRTASSIQFTWSKN